MNFCQRPQRQEASRPHPHHGDKNLNAVVNWNFFVLFFLNLWRHWLELNWTKHGLKQLELSLICPKYKYSMEKNSCLLCAFNFLYINVIYFYTFRSNTDIIIQNVCKKVKYLKISPLNRIFSQVFWKNIYSIAKPPSPCT